MILIVDGGATKSDWIALNDKGKQLFFTHALGLSPEVLTRKQIEERLTHTPELFNNKDRVTELYFYGAGCDTEEVREAVTEILKAFFPNANVEVEEDIYAALYATTKPGQQGIVCILGTGANCRHYDGQQLHQKIVSLGYVIMDDGSGNFLGKKMLRDYYLHKMPEDLALKFTRAHDLSAHTIKENLYKNPSPNTYLASFARFLIKHKAHPYCNGIIEKGLQQFVNNYIMQFDVATKVPIHFVGSIAYFLSEELATVLERNDLILGVIQRRPIEGLVAFHRERIQSKV